MSLILSKVICIILQDLFPPIFDCSIYILKWTLLNLWSSWSCWGGSWSWCLSWRAGRRAPIGRRRKTDWINRRGINLLKRYAICPILERIACCIWILIHINIKYDGSTLIHSYQLINFQLNSTLIWFRVELVFASIYIYIYITLFLL